MITVCGIYCESECRAFGKECRGCIQLKGRVPWVRFIDMKVCPIYECVKRKGFVTCLECEELPCRFWLIDTKNPDTSDEDYAQHIRRRIENLKNMAK